MVFQVRDKSLFWTRGGWKNNWHPKNFNAPKMAYTELTCHGRTRMDHHSFLRLHNSYRNISRLFRQYFYGSKRLEEMFILELREHFRVPLTSHCRTDEIKHGGERRFADQINRDEELASYNTHPFQLAIYSLNNKHLATKTSEYELNLKGQLSHDQQAAQDIQAILKQEEAKLPAGEKLSLEKAAEVILGVARQMRPRADERNQLGDFNDFLEQRRPFPQQ
jgi:hypothetical protein